MAFKRRRAELVLDDAVREELQALSLSYMAPVAHVERARVLLGYADGETVSSIARRLGTNRPKVERTIDRALRFGARTALDDLPRMGRPREITEEARAWVMALACRKPKDLGYPEEMWTTARLAKHIRSHCEQEGHPSLARLGRGTVSKLLAKNKLRPHKITYYLERRDPDFDRKMAEVLHVYREVQMLLAEQEAGSEPGLVAILSYDEKPGIQAIENTAPDLPPVPGRHPEIARDYEYKRHGTLSLLCGIDLLTGDILGRVEERHRSREFVAWLQDVHAHYPEEWKIRIILDNHTAHTSVETRKYLATVPNRFEFTFTPTHGSWLNLIEVFFSKLARTLLRGIRVKSKAELKSRIEAYLADLNQTPVVFRWKYGLDETSAA
jgi:transposase